MSDLLQPASDRASGGGPPPWPATAAECRLDDLRRIVEPPQDYASPTAEERIAGVPVYQAEALSRAAASEDGADRPALLSEIGSLLLDGPGIVVVRDAVDPDAVDRASAVFESIIEEQHRSGVGGGDHYAKPGANDRIWNSLEKLALADPEVFVDYHRSEAVALVAEAWLGPGYQMSAQVNVVNPGGEAQRPHRDYHLGFMTEEQAARFPRHAHLLSPVLTLQGAVSHGSMPLESGPTKLLAHSQKYEPGFLAWRRPEFIDYFEANHIQLPLELGDALFFNPAVFHAAGTNRTADVRRMANLLQISSAMGRAMERIDRHRMCLALYPVLLARLAAGMDPAAIDRVVASAAEGYAFPADLDVDQPIGGLAPPSQADRLRQALEERWTAERLAAEL